MKYQLFLLANLGIEGSAGTDVEGKTPAGRTSLYFNEWVKKL